MERLTRGGAGFCFEDAGKGAPPVLLIHDLGSDHRSMHPQLEHLRARHRVVAPDLLGHGQSDDLPGPNTVGAFARDLAWLCYELGLYRPVAIGRGIGGAIAVELAARYPDLLACVIVVGHPVVSQARVFPHPYLAATAQNVRAWEAAASLSACKIPLRYVRTAACQKERVSRKSGFALWRSP